MTFNATPPTQTYTYDQENRLTGAAGYAYTYDSDGNRVRKSSGSTGTLYWYMTPGIVSESDLSGNLTDEYVFFDGERVARKSTNGVFYYFSDHLKTASVITDSAGNIKSESDFYPWGGELQFVNNDSNHYKFTGKERDSETQLDYFGARYYSNGLGRWVSADWSAIPVPVPYADLSDPQSLNLFGFVRGLPTTKVDIDGHGWWQKFKNSAGDAACWCEGEEAEKKAKQNRERQEAADFAMQVFVQDPKNKQSVLLFQMLAVSSWVDVLVDAFGEATPGQVVGENAPAAEESVAGQLQGAANSASTAVGPGKGAVHGTAVHTEFESAVKALGNSNLSTEISYKNGVEVPRGTPGSIRVDVAEGPKNAPSAIYDLKTGGAKLTPTRVQQIQSHLPGGTKVPVKEVKPQR